MGQIRRKSVGWRLPRVGPLRAGSSAAVRALGVLAVAQAFAPFIPAHETLAVCFSTRCVERLEECETALLEYFHQLQGQVSLGFLWSREW